MKKWAYYNEINPQICEWLKSLMKRGLIMDGDIDQRSICDVHKDDVKDYIHCHWFAGVAGWNYALQLAGYPDDRQVWTGSCPCQPFSTAGNRKGKDDDRHLWPAWFKLIKECKPATIFGEQVAAAVAFGWLDEVANDLEAEGYAFGTAVLPACSVGAPHKRDRLFFVGHTELNGQHGSAKPGGIGASTDEGRVQQSERPIEPAAMGDTIGEGLERYPWNEPNWYKPRRHNTHTKRPARQTGIFITCPDGKQRFIEPRIPMLVDGVSAGMAGVLPYSRKVALEGLGNAIVPDLAAEFIVAFMGGNYNGEGQN